MKMEKNLKDYLHLYLPYGISVFVFPDESITDGFLDKYRQDYPNGIFNPILTFDNYKRFIADGYKPILRQLSNMTEEENEEWAATNIHNDRYMDEAEATKYLLSKHFDLFGLIESGLAIDKTKITQPQP